MACYDTPQDHDIFLVERPLGFIVEAPGRVESFPFAFHRNALEAAEDFIAERHEGEAIWFCQPGEVPVIHEAAERQVEARYDSHPSV